MNTISRRGTLLAGIAGMLGIVQDRALAQNQGIGNDIQLVSTGNIDLDNAIGASQRVITVSDGYAVVGPNGASQGVSNDVQIVSTGNISATNSVGADQEVYTEAVAYDDGSCDPGEVRAQIETGILYYCAADCVWHPVPCCSNNGCKKGRC